MKTRMLIASGALALTMPVVAQATTAVIPPAAYGVYIGGIGSSPGPVATTSATPLSTSYVFYYGLGNEIFSAATAPLPNATSTVTIEDSGHLESPYGFATTASINYYFTVTGPSDAQVPIIYNGNISLSGNAGNNSNVAVSAEDILAGYSTNANSLCGSFSEGGTCPLSQVASGSFPINENLTIPVNTTENVYVEAYLSDQGNDAPAFTETLTVDPFIQIDPSWLANHPGYSLEFSSGIGNLPLSAVPDPTTWSMMLMGFGVVGYAVRMRPRVRRQQELALA